VVEPSAPTVTVAMPPRTPIWALGVRMMTSPFLLIAPPTKRKAPFVALTASSPALRLASKTNLSIVNSLLAPTVRPEPSRKTRCARSAGPVVTRSLPKTSMPTRRVRAGCAGGVPRGSPLAADVTPTCCADAAVAQASGKRSVRKIARDFRKDIAPLPQNRQPMPTRLLNELKL